MQLLEGLPLSTANFRYLRAGRSAKADRAAAKRNPSSRSWEDWVLLAVVVAYCGWVFSLPLFPTQDGAVHLYYAQVISRLLSKSALYSQYFAIRYPIPPYALHYVLLLGLTKLLPPLVAEKAIVCLTISTFVYGFRALARKLGPSAGIATLWIVPLSLNWMMGMGFYSFCLSMALGLWAMAFWLRAITVRTFGSWAAYYVCLTAILFTHPVPLAITVAFVASELTLRVIQQVLREKEKWNSLFHTSRALITDITFALLSFLPLAYVGLFVRKDSAPPDVHMHHMGLMTVLSLGTLKTLSVVGKNPIGLLYRLSFYFILFVAMKISFRGFRQRWATRKLRVSDLMILGSLLLGLAIPVLPRSLNGSDYFADRLVIYIWIGAIASAACHVHQSGRFQQFMCAAGALFGITALVLANHYVRPVAEHIALLETVRSKAPGESGMFINSPAQPQISSRVSFDPYVWAAARYFRQTDTIMLNAPWLSLSIIPLDPQGEELAKRFNYLVDYPDRFRDALVHSETMRAQIAFPPEFVVSIQIPGAAPDPIFTNQLSQDLSCRETNGLQLCSRLPAQTH